MQRPKLFEFVADNVVCRAKHFAPNTPCRVVVTITAAIGQVQEQAPLQYAERLAAAGLHAVTFDHRFYGLSDGEPRQLEHPDKKVEDIKALAAFIKSSELFRGISHVVALGICKGGAYSLRAAAACPSIDSFIGVSGFYFDDHSLEAASGYKAQRIEQGRKAVEEYQRTGKVEYLPITHDVRKDAALQYPALHAWYAPWEVTSRWQNRYAVMSDYFIYQHQSAPDARALDKPALIILDEFFAIFVAKHLKNLFPGNVGSVDHLILAIHGAHSHVQRGRIRSRTRPSRKTAHATLHTLRNRNSRSADYRESGLFGRNGSVGMLIVVAAPKPRVPRRYSNSSVFTGLKPCLR